MRPDGTPSATAEVPRVWVLNLDAEDELASPHVPRDPFAALMARPRLVDALTDLVRCDVVLGRGDRAPPAAIGRAFSPTPRALEALARAGAVVPAAPDVAVLRRVSDRRFGLSLGAGHVPGATVLERAEDLAFAARSHPGPRVLKRIFSFAGRGRLLSQGGPPSDAERAFVARATRDDGAVVLEPWLARTLDLGLHGFISRAGDLTLGMPTVQDVTSGGAWRASRLAAAGETLPEEDQTLASQAHLVAGRLQEVGYFGPFGIDAFRAPAAGVSVLVPRCEVNARYSMGWAIGMGSLRPDLDP